MLELNVDIGENHQNQQETLLVYVVNFVVKQLRKILGRLNPVN